MGYWPILSYPILSSIPLPNNSPVKHKTLFLALGPVAYDVNLYDKSVDDEPMPMLLDEPIGLMLNPMGLDADRR